MAATRHLSSKFWNGFVLAGLSILVVQAAMLEGSATVVASSGECQSRYMSSLFSCFSEYDVPFNSYLWAVSNGSVGVRPKDPPAFKQRMCSEESAMLSCVLDILHTLSDSGQCSGQDDIHEQLTTQLRAVFKEYDNYCAHECRQTLEKDMRSCYSNLSLDTSLFMPDNGAILGESETSVAKFCTHQDELMTCLKEKRDACPESSYVMKRLGLDLSTYKAGVKLLCSKPKDYVTSLDCFNEQTREVEKCVEDHAMTLKKLLVTSHNDGNTTQAEIFQEFCVARLQFVECDLRSWSRKWNDACGRRSLSLKRDLHCSQVPVQCRQILQQPVQQMCSHEWGTNPPPMILLPADGGSLEVADIRMVVVLLLLAFLTLF